MKKFFISTAIDYPSGPPHAGHLYEKILADAFARHRRLRGDRVHFSTGLDCHGQKMVRTAAKRGQSASELVADMEILFRKLCDAYSISFDDFILTTEPRHHAVVKNVFEKIWAKGDIYKGQYEGAYCTECETYYTQKDAPDNVCPVHGRPLDWLVEETYFFKMSKYQDALVDAIQNRPELVWPESKRNELLARLAEPLKDLSISRTSFDWGILFPADARHVFYVWMDALINYLTTIDYPEKKFEAFWPADMHLIGRDIAWHHTAIWYSILLAADLPLPRVVCHGFINTSTGDKMSKSLGNVIDPFDLEARFGSESVRYFLLREIPFGADGRFRFDALATRHNRELANDLGNLVFRVLSMIQRYNAGKIPAGALDLSLLSQLDVETIEASMNDREPHAALAHIFSFVNASNKFITVNEPWKQSDARARNTTLYTLAESVRRIAIVLAPFLPKTSARIFHQLNLPVQGLDDLANAPLRRDHVLRAPEILFSKIEVSAEAKPGARPIEVRVESGVAQLGLKAVSGVIEHVSVKKKHEGLERLKAQTVKDFPWDREKEAHVQGFEEIYKKLGINTGLGNTDASASHAGDPAAVPLVNSVRNLRALVEKSGQLPQINTLVDCYNIVSFRHAVVVGAHDIDRVQGDLRFALLSGSEKYVPLFSRTPQRVRAGEFGVLDDAQVLCWLDVKQCDATRVDKPTKHVVFYVQGNEKTDLELLRRARDEIGRLAEQFCGGAYRPLD